MCKIDKYTSPCNMQICFSIKAIPPVLAWLDRVVLSKGHEGLWEGRKGGAGDDLVISLVKVVWPQGLVYNKWMQTIFKHKI